jgi:hypothetical protein
MVVLDHKHEGHRAQARRSLAIRMHLQDRASPGDKLMGDARRDITARRKRPPSPESRRKKEEKGNEKEEKGQAMCNLI